MQLMEQRGAWGRVLFSNGWSGWVDARRLVAVPAPASAPPAAPPFRPAPPPEQAQPAQPEQAQPEQAQPAAPAQQPVEANPFQLPPQDQPVASEFFDEETTAWAAAPEPEQPHLQPAPGLQSDRSERRAEGKPAHTGLGASSVGLSNFKISPAPIGAVVVLVGSLLPWISITGFSGNAFRVPMKFLIDYKTTGGGLKVGLLLVAAAVVAGVFCVLPGRVLLRRIMGGVAILIAVIYVIQLQRVLSSGGKAAPSLTSAVGFGVLVVIAGGVALIVDQSEPSGD
jgi:hypothetical protein